MGDAGSILGAWPQVGGAAGVILAFGYLFRIISQDRKQYREDLRAMETRYEQRLTAKRQRELDLQVAVDGAEARRRVAEEQLHQWRIGNRDQA